MLFLGNSTTLRKGRTGGLSPRIHCLLKVDPNGSASNLKGVDHICDEHWADEAVQHLVHTRGKPLQMELAPP